MTVLSYQTIRRYRVFDPFCERTLHEPSNLTYGCGPASYDVRLGDAVTLRENQVILTSTMEHFTMPENLCGVVHDKSSLARIGVLVQNTLIDPGFCGYLTLEISYHKVFSIPELSGLPDPYPKPSLHLEVGTPIAQVVLHKLDHPTEMPYSGHYQEQERGAQVSKFKHPSRVS